MKSFVSVAVLLSFLIFAGMAFAEEAQASGRARDSNSYRGCCCSPGCPEDRHRGHCMDDCCGCAGHDDEHPRPGALLRRPFKTEGFTQHDGHDLCLRFA